MSKYINLNAAIRILWGLSLPRCDYESGAKELESLPTIEVREDAISKAYLEQKIENQTMSVEKDKEYWRGWNNALDKVIELIEDAPSVIPKPKEGEWILECDAEGEGDNLYRCPECGQRCGCQEYDLPNYCGNCGAKMKGVINDRSDKA